MKWIGEQRHRQRMIYQLVQVEELSSPLSVESYERLNRIDPLQQSDAFGIDIYLSCLEATQTFDV